jgi:hypothetical protein
MGARFAEREEAPSLENLTLLGWGVELLQLPYNLDGRYSSKWSQPGRSEVEE